MKNAFWAYWLILLGVLIVVIMLLVRNLTTTSTQDYYLLKELTNAAMIDAIDYSYYRNYGEIRINKEKFYESFLRRFAETANLSTTYTISFYGVYEAPPKVSVEIKSKSNTFNIAGDVTQFDMVERIDSILEGKPLPKADGTYPTTPDNPTPTPDNPTPEPETPKEIVCEEKDENLDTKSVGGMKGTAMKDGLTVYKNKNKSEKYNDSLKPGDDIFEIVGEDSKAGLWQIKWQGTNNCGWIDYTYAGINLVDYLKGDRVGFDIRNNYSSLFKLGNDDIYDTEGNKVTGKKLYTFPDGFVPAAYVFAKELKKVAEKVPSGSTLTIVDAYRPYSISNYVRNSAYNTSLKNHVSYWGSSDYVDNYIQGCYGSSCSKHNYGCAVDAVLGGVSNTSMHNIAATAATRYDSNNPDHKTLYDLFRNNSALTLIGGGKEWWHYELSSCPIPKPLDFWTTRPGERVMMDYEF